MHPIVEEIEARVHDLPVRNTPVLRSLRREFSNRLKPVPPREIVRIAAGLIARRRVHRFVADELIAARSDALATVTPAQLERLGSGISSWDQVDSFACILSGPLWRDGRIPDQAILRWARSAGRWWRRTALVSTVPLNVKARGGHGDARRTLRVCLLLIADRDDMVVKAMSWALRALAVADPDAVRQFLNKHELRLPALVLREVRHKLATGRKNRKSDKLRIRR